MADSLNILWVKSGPLYPVNTGGRKRTHAMLMELAKHHKVTYLALVDGSEISDEEEKAPYAQTKIWIPWKDPGRTIAPLRNALFSDLPFVLDKYRSPEMRNKLTELDQSGKFDLIFCDFLTMAPDVAESVKHTPSILFQHNIEAQIWKRLAINKKNPVARKYFSRQAARMAEAEEKLSELFPGIITVSPEDSEHCRQEYKLKNVLGHVPTGVDTDFFENRFSESPKHPKRIAFLGSMDWMPNIEAVDWFVRESLPSLRLRVPGVEFIIIGRNPPPSVRALADNEPDILVTGTVPDVRPVLEECSAMVVPLKSGGGTRIKIIEAMSMGIPVVSTTIGAEGLELTPGKHIIISDDADELSSETASLITDPDLRKRISQSARERVESHHTWEHATNIFVQHCRTLLDSRTKP